MNQYSNGPVVWPEQTRSAAPPGVPTQPSAPPPAKKPRPQGKKNKKIANSVVALGSAAILSVYGLGYVHTQAAEDRLTTNIAAENTPVAIATAASTATTAPTATAVAQSPAFNSPVFGPSGNAAPASTGGAQSVATPTAPAPTATTAAATATKAPATAAASTSAYKDGSYTGTGTSRHGNITATVVIQGGKIVSANVTQCGTRYSCGIISALPGEVVSRQSAKVDFVSGATDSSMAYQGAITSALKKASAG
jgi:uncharacterized protein with FMN-binding domain